MSATILCGQSLAKPSSGFTVLPTKSNATRKSAIFDNKPRLAAKSLLPRVGSSSTVSGRWKQGIVCGTGSSSSLEELEKPTSKLGSFVIPTTGMAKIPGSGGRGGGALMEKKKFSLKQTVRQTGPKLDQGSGGGNNGGIKDIGGGGGGDDDDDDDYGFGEGDDDGEPDSNFFRSIFAEIYDPSLVKTILTEWGKTIGDLPGFMRVAFDLGLVSTTAALRFCSSESRPTMTRSLIRSLPNSFRKEVTERIMADSAFLQKMVFEQTITAGCSLTYEFKVRGDRFWKELDLVATNTAALMAANATAFFLLAPARRAVAVTSAEGISSWQTKVAAMPNNLFEAESKMRAFSSGSRAASFGLKALELTGVGMMAGTVQALISHGLVALKQKAQPSYRPSQPVADIKAQGVNMAATTGLLSNIRFQSIAGLETRVFDRINTLWVGNTFSLLFRIASAVIGDELRLGLQGLPGRAVVSPEVALKQRYERLIQQRALTAAAASSPSTTKKRRRRRKSKSSGHAIQFAV